jgi:predicted nucleic acid-binding protein
MTPQRLVVHTDILLDHLECRRPPSVLRRVLRLYFCYTTVFSAMELFGRAETPAERRAVEDVLGAIKTLGVNARNARRYASLLSEHRGRAWQDLLTAGLCLESRLPLLTGNPRPFRGIRGLELVAASTLGRESGRTTARSHG